MDLQQYINSISPDEPIDLYKMSKEVEMDIDKLRSELFELLDSQEVKGHVNDLDQTFTKGKIQDYHWVERAKEAYNDGRYEDTLTSLSEIIDSVGDNPVLWQLYGESCIQLKQ